MRKIVAILVKRRNRQRVILIGQIDDIVIATIDKYGGIPLKAINKQGALDDLKSDEDKAKEEEKKPVAEKIKKALGDKVRDVIISSRLVSTPAAVVLGDNDPSVQMQRLMKQMGAGDDMDVKPILEVNPDSPVIQKIEKSDDEEAAKEEMKILSSNYNLLVERDRKRYIADLTRQMTELAKNLEFEKAALLRDEIQRIKDRKDLES